MRAVISVVVLLAASVASRASAQPPAVQVLPVEGYGAAALVAPREAGPRPVVVVLHGNFDRPEWACANWAPIVDGRAWLLCPRGIPRRDAPAADRWELPAMHLLQPEIASARAALVALHGARIGEGDDVYVGFSQGAHRVAQLANTEPARYPRIQLVEGGRTLWRARPARRFGHGEGRVALVCSTPWCAQRSAAVRRHTPDERVRFEHTPGAHHDFGVMRPAIRRTFDWLVQGDRRFAR